MASKQGDRVLPTGECWCGCGVEVGLGSFFAPGHDKVAEGWSDPEPLRKHSRLPGRPRLRTGRRDSAGGSRSSPQATTREALMPRNSKIADIQLSDGQEDTVSLVSLLLDPSNPRLAADAVAAGTTQDELVVRLWTEMAADQVALDRRQRYYTEERLLVVANTGSPNQYPRATSWLGKPAAGSCSVSDSAGAEAAGSRRARSSGRLDSDAMRRLRQLPVRSHQRKRLCSTSGFRPSTARSPGTRRIHQSHYIADVHEQYEIPLPEIARRSGDRHSTVARLYRGIKILEQAEQNAVFDVSDRARNRVCLLPFDTAAD